MSLFDTLKGVSDWGRSQRGPVGWFFNSANSAGTALGNGIKAMDLTGSQAQQNEYDKNLALQQQAQAFNSAEAEKDRRFQEYMSNTAYSRAFKDLESAGYNPYIALTSGAAASTPGGVSASSSAASVSRQNNKLYEASYKLADSIVKLGQSTSASNMNALVRLAGVAIMALA